MTVFKTYFKVLLKNKAIIFIYSAILIVFTIFSTTSNDNTVSFSASKPSVAVINNDKDSKITENLINYIKDNADIIDLENNEKVLSDALFYREISSIIYIYDGYTEDYLNNKEKKIYVEFTTDYYASYTRMLLDRYFKIADVVNNNINDEDKIIEIINNSLATKTEIEINNTIDTDSLSAASYYYSFANYSILAICIFLIAAVMGTFNNTNIRKRNIVSSKRISSLTKELYLGNLVFTFIVWLFVVLLSFFVVGKVMFTINGLWIIINSFVFMFAALGIGFLIGTIVKNKDSINGIVNVVALGSSFLCGCFVPVELMPDSIINFSKILPSYWYIHNNNLIKTIEVFNFDTVLPLLINMLIMVGFAILFFVLAFIYNKKHQKN